MPVGLSGADILKLTNGISSIPVPYQLSGPCLEQPIELLGMLALCIGTTLIIKMGKAKYIWATLVPMLFMASTTFTASFELIQAFIHKSSTSPDPVTFRINALLMGIMLILSVVVVADSAIKWYGYLVKKQPIKTTEVTVYSSHRTN